MKLKHVLLLCGVILTIITVIGCGGGEKVAKDGDTVAVHYTGTLADGTEFDSSRGREPLQFVVGAGQMIPGFDKAVNGMKVGEVKTVTLPPEEAYGPYRPEMVLVVEREKLPPELVLEFGLQIQITSETGDMFIATVTEFTETTVTMDANHQLAGQELTFEIELVEIQ